MPKKTASRSPYVLRKAKKGKDLSREKRIWLKSPPKLYKTKNQYILAKKTRELKEKNEAQAEKRKEEQEEQNKLIKMDDFLYNIKRSPARNRTPPKSPKMLESFDQLLKNLNIKKTKDDYDTSMDMYHSIVNRENSSNSHSSSFNKSRSRSQSSSPGYDVIHGQKSRKNILDELWTKNSPQPKITTIKRKRRLEPRRPRKYKKLPTRTLFNNSVDKTYLKRKIGSNSYSKLNFTPSPKSQNSATPVNSPYS